VSYTRGKDVNSRERQPPGHGRAAERSLPPAPRDRLGVSAARCLQKYCNEKKADAGSWGCTVKAWERSEGSNSGRQVCRVQKRMILSILGRKEILEVRLISWKMVDIDNDSGKPDTAIKYFCPIFGSHIM